MGKGDQQMFCQAAAVLVALATFLASKLNPAALLAVLGEGLTIASTPDAGLLILIDTVVRRQVVRIVNRTATHLTLEFELGDALRR